MVKYRAETFLSSLDTLKLTGRKRVKTSIILNKTHFRQHGVAAGSSDAAQLQGLVLSSDYYICGLPHVFLMFLWAYF